MPEHKKNPFEEKIKAAIDHEEKYEFDSAIKIYEDIKNELMLNDDKLLPLHYDLKICINKLKKEHYYPSTNDLKIYKDSVDELFLKIDKTEIDIYKKGQPAINFLELKLMILRTLERHLSELDLEQQSWNLTIKILNLSNEIRNRKLDKKPLYWRFWLKITDIGVSNIFGKFFEYGLNIRKIISSTIFIWLAFGVLYYGLDKLDLSLGKIWRVDQQPADFWQCLFFSLVTLTSLGTEEFWPLGWLFKILYCLEAIIGFVLLSLFISYFARKIK